MFLSAQAPKTCRSVVLQLQLPLYHIMGAFLQAICNSRPLQPLGCDGRWSDPDRVLRLARLCREGATPCCCNCDILHAAVKCDLTTQTRSQLHHEDSFVSRENGQEVAYEQMSSSPMSQSHTNLATTSCSSWLMMLTETRWAEGSWEIVNDEFSETGASVAHSLGDSVRIAHAPPVRCGCP